MAAPHPLDGCFARLKRAEAHLHALKTALGYNTSDRNPIPVDIPLKVNIDNERNVATIVCTHDIRLPVDIGVILSDLFHNLHATLDNLAYELGGLDGRTPVRTSQFPIIEKADEWFTNDVRLMLASIRPQDRARIEAHQPFMAPAGDPPKHHVLARLKRYSNESKHRVVTPIGGVTMVSVLDEVIPKDMDITAQRVAPNKTLRQNAVLATFAFTPTGPEPNVSVKGRLGWYPAMDKGDSVEQFAVTLVAYVHDLLVEFNDNCF